MLFAGLNCIFIQKKKLNMDNPQSVSSRPKNSYYTTLKNTTSKKARKRKSIAMAPPMHNTRNNILPGNAGPSPNTKNSKNIW